MKQRVYLIQEPWEKQRIFVADKSVILDDNLIRLIGSKWTHGKWTGRDHDLPLKLLNWWCKKGWAIRIQ